MQTHKMRLECFTPRLGTGGAEMQLLRLLNSFDRTSVTPGLVVARSGGNYESMLRPDVSLVNLTEGLIKSSTLNVLSSVPALIAHIRRVRPDVVLSILDPAIAAASVAIRSLPKSRRPKFVACIQNNFTLESRNRKFGAKCFQPIINQGYKSADLIIGLSKGVVEDLHRNIPATQTKTRIIYNAAHDSERLLRTAQAPKLERPTDDFLIVSCGRFVEQKGFPFLIEAIANVRRGRKVHLWMLGTGPDTEKIKQLVRSLGLEASVTFWGFQDNPLSFFRAADLFVLSSVYEGFGNVLVEAMSCGTPVLSTQCPFGPEEIISDGVNGLLVQAGDSRAIQAGIEYAMDHPDVLKKIGASGRIRALDFDSAKIAEQYLEAIQDLVGRGDNYPRFTVGLSNE